MQLHYPSAGSWLSHWRTLEGETIIYLSTSTSVAMSSWHQTQLTLAINCLSGSSAVLYRGLSFQYRIHWCSDCPYGLYLHYIDPGVDKMLIVQPAALPSRLAFETLDVSWALAHLGLNWVDCSVKDLIAPALQRRLSCWCSGPERGGPAEGQILARLSVKALKWQCVCDRILGGVSSYAAGTSVHDLWMIYEYLWYDMVCGSVRVFWGYPG